MTRDKSRVARDVDAAFGFQHAERRQRHRHQGWLCVFGELKRLGRPLPDNCSQLLTQCRIDLVEHGLGCRECVGQRLAHADGLRALSGKRECCGHQSLRNEAVKSPPVADKSSCGAAGSSARSLDQSFIGPLGHWLTGFAIVYMAVAECLPV